MEQHAERVVRSCTDSRDRDGRRGKKVIMRIPTFLASLTLVLLLASCAWQPIRLASVGPPPVAARQIGSQVGKGQLQVFTETEEYEYGKDVPYFPHSDYHIYTLDGKHLKRIWNSQNHEDEAPAVVDLPAGTYLINAQAEFCGEVLIPVVIKPHTLTPVILQPGWKPRAGIDPSKLVKSPAGYYIGWKADLASSE